VYGSGTLEGPVDETFWPNEHGMAFCALAAACLVGVRLLLFESRLFRGICIPNHDMSQGIAFFATNLQSLRLSGEIVWWNPFSSTGYAQYYQSFLSPLAPTPHHLTFVVWSYATRLLSWLHVRTPSEYSQYLAFNYLLLPFLTFWALGELMRGIVRHPAAVLLAMATYALSSIGIWNAAWFYSQETCTLLFLLATFVHAVRCPSGGRIALLGVAVLVQVASLNYWSVYNTLFLLTVLTAFACCHPRELSRLLRAVVELIRRRRSARIGALLVAGTCACWVGLIASIVQEQSGGYVRTYADRRPVGSRSLEVISMGTGEAAATRVKGVRTFTIELFNPGIEIALENYPAMNPAGPEPPVHNARYLGTVLLPLLALAPFLGWPRATAWVIPTAAFLFVICLAPSFLATIVAPIPFLGKIEHLFYFYTAHWQLLLVILSACVLDAVLRQPEPRMRRRLLVVLGITAGAMLLALGGLRVMASWLPGTDRHLGSYVRALGFALTSAVLLALILSARTHSARIAGTLLLLAALLVDLGWYFAHVSVIDQNFTSQYWHVPTPITAEYRARLFKPLPDPDVSLGFDAGLADGLPIANDFYPTNRFMTPAAAVEATRHMDIFRRLDWKWPLDLYRKRERTSDHPFVLLHDARDSVEGLRWQSLDWAYNDFAFRFTAEFPGWLFLRQLHDPLWRYTIDGEERRARPANFIGTALRVDRGTHELRMSYRPRARRLYGPACAMLSITVAFLLGLWAQDRRRAGGQPAELIGAQALRPIAEAERLAHKDLSNPPVPTPSCRRWTW
jgi:hypothetical protein